MGIWNTTIQNPKTFQIQTFCRLDFKWSVFKWLGISYCYNYSPIIRKLDILSGFQVVFDKMATIWLVFTRLGFRISYPIWDPDHLQPNLFLTSPNFRSQLYLFLKFVLYAPRLRLFHLSHLAFWTECQLKIGSQDINFFAFTFSAHFYLFRINVFTFLTTDF